MLRELAVSYFLKSCQSGSPGSGTVLMLPVPAMTMESVTGSLARELFLSSEPEILNCPTAPEKPAGFFDSGSGRTLTET